MSKQETSEVVTAMRLLTGVSIIAIVVLAICFLANIGYNTYIKVNGTKKEIEVQAVNSINSNSISSTNEWGLSPYSF